MTAAAMSSARVAATATRTVPTACYNLRLGVLSRWRRGRRASTTSSATAVQAPRPPPTGLRAGTRASTASATTVCDACVRACVGVCLPGLRACVRARRAFAHVCVRECQLPVGSSCVVITTQSFMLTRATGEPVTEVAYLPDLLANTECVGSSACYVQTIESGDCTENDGDCEGTWSACDSSDTSTCTRDYGEWVGSEPARPTEPRPHSPPTPTPPAPCAPPSVLWISR